MQEKQCRICKENKELSQFHKCAKAKDGLQSKCKPCNIKERTEYYKTHKKEHREYDKARLNKTKQIMCEYLSANPCIDCLESDIIVLEFDHLENKKANIADMIRAGFSPQKLFEEISKCEVVCANCHRRRTAKRAGNWLKANQ